MGKKTTKRKTRWRTLSIGEVPSDTEEETHENHTTPNYYKNVKLRSFKTPTPTSDNNSTRSTFNNYSYRCNSGGSNNSSSYYYNHSTTHNGTSTPSNTTNHHHYQREPSSYGAGAHYQRTSSDYTSSFHHNLRNGGSGSSTSTGGGGVAASTSQSSHSTPIRSRYHRNHGYNGTGDKYKSSRSNSTASEPKITFNEDEYTRITTPRQDVLFKKGYLSKKKPLTVVSGDTAQNHHDSNGLMANGGTGQHHMNGHSGGIINNGGGGSCGESNPSTGYNSTTGGGTPEHHSLDGGDYYDTDIDQHQPPFIIHNGFVDHNGVFYVNGYDPFSMMLIGPPPPPPPGQFIHPVDFYPPPPPSVSGVPCFPQITPSTSINNQNDSTTSNSSKRCSTDSQADESNSPHNENESSGETNNFASSEQSQSSSLDNNLDQQSSDNQTNNLTPTNTDSGVQIIDDNNTTDDCAKSNPDDGSSDSVEPITNSSSTQSQTTTISSTSVPIVEEDVIVPTNDGLVETPPAPILPMQQSNSFVAPRIYPIPATPTHFFLTAGPPPTGFIPFPPPTAVPGQPIYINDINIQPSSALNLGIVDPSKQRYIQKRRRRKLSKSQNDIEKKYSDNSGSSTSDEFEPEELSLEKHSASLDDTANDKTPTIEMYSVIDDISNETKDKQLPSPRCTPPPLVNGDSVITNDSKETQKSLSTVYKLDAEEFVPRSMRLQQTASTSIDEKSINPELRAKFENYLNRQSTNISDEQNGYMVGEFIPSDFIFHHPGEIHHHYQLEQQLIGTSYPSSQAPPQASKHFIHHNQFLPPRRQFVNGYNKKRQKYIKPNHYYKSNYKNYSHDQQQQSTSTKVEHDDDNKADDCKPQSMTETHVNTETNESASLPIEKTITDNDEDVTKDLVLSKVDSKENVEPKLEVTASNDETNKSLEVVVVTPSENKSINEIQKKNESHPSITCANQDEKITKTETFDKSVMTVIDDKPNVTSTDVKEQQITPSSPIRIHKPLQKIENNSPTVLKVSSKNYAQILRKDDKMTTSIQQSKTIRKDNLTATKTSPVSSKIQNKTKTVQQPIRQLLKSSPQNVQKSTTNKIQIEPVHRPKVPLVNSLPEDNEWISVPSRKKGKVKSYQQIPLSMSLHENYLTPELIDKVEKVSEPKVEKTEPIVNTTEETVKTEEILDSSASTETVVASNKSVSPAVQIKNTKKPVVNKLSHTPKNSVKKTKINDSVIKSDKQIEKIKTPIENVISKQETVMPQQSTTPPDVSKKQKGKSLKKQVIKENNPSTNQNTAIGESIDNLRKMSTEHSKTNIEISKEMDRLIQQGLYKNLGNTIKSLGHDKEFLSIIDPNINILPKMMFDPQLKMKGQNENLLELNIMETLNECQRYFANKNIKDVMFDSSSSTKDVKNQTVQDEETNSNIASVVGSSVTSDDGNVQICDSVETNNKASQISNISASIPSTSRVDETRDEQVEKLSTTPNGVLITATSSSSDKNIDEKTDLVNYVIWNVCRA
ncbi:FK506-binding protein 5-like isoform X2 [Chrysoperla carnea]|uniref:FK506-binding protein 5-like isoform X2 n=1 Tax=Chrysoperla carnea TaxID=189513 RepID=UPI001D088845|nr:FK506-binding protein 5-like isoform X2 [Chrysoperla carnea]